MVQIRKITILGVLLALMLLLAGTAHAELAIHDFELKSAGDDETVKPGESLFVSFDVVNDGDYDIEDIEVTLWFKRGSTQLEDNEGVDIEPDFNLRDIDAGDDKNVDYELIVPWNVDDRERYDVYVKVKGKNADDNTRQTLEDVIGDFKIEKLSHELYVDASFNPESADCGDEVILNLDVRNIGSHDEDDVNITAVNTLIGVNVKELVYLDNSFDDKDNNFEKTYSFDVNDNLNPGMYELTVRATYDGGYEENFKTIDLKVDNCEQTVSIQPSQPSTQPNDSAIYTPTNPTNTQPTAPSGSNSVTTYVPAQPSDNGSKSSSNSTIIILVVLGEIGLVIIIVLVYLLVRKPKQPKLSDF